MAEKVEFKIGWAETANSHSLCMPWDMERHRGGEGAGPMKAFASIET